MVEKATDDVDVSTTPAATAGVESQPQSSAEAIVRGLIWTGLGLYAVCWLWVVHTRVGSHQELNWFGGLFADGLRQLRSGHGLYPAPSDGFIPLTYPPMFFWAAALLEKLGIGDFAAMRLVSLLSSLGIALLLGRTLWRHTRSNFWTAVAIGLFLASYGMCGSAHDLELPLALMSFLALAGTVLVLERSSRWATLLAAVLFAAAALTQLSALWFVVGAAIAVTMLRGWRRGIEFAAVALGMVATILAALHVQSGGWSSYYILGLPLKHTLDSDFAGVFACWELPRLVIPTVLVLVGLLHSRTRRSALAVLVLAACVTTVFARLHVGGTVTALMPFIVLLCLATPLAAADMVAAPLRSVGHQPRLPFLVYLLVLAQLPLSYYEPTFFGASGLDALSRQSFLHELTRLEASVGDTWVASHGDLTTTPHPHFQAVQNIMRTQGRKIPEGVEQAIRTHKFKAIVVDDLWAMPLTLRERIQREYFVGQRIALTPWDHSDPISTPEWVLFPRKEPLPDYTPTTVVDQITDSEMTLAKISQRMRGEDSPNMDVPSTRERTARSMADAILYGDEAVRDELCRNNIEGELCRALWRYMRQRRVGAVKEPSAWAGAIEALARDRALWEIERKALLNEIDCLRTRPVGDPDAARRCYDISGASPEPAGP